MSDAPHVLRVPIPPLVPGGGLLPVSGGYETARDDWASAWQAQADSWTSRIRAAQRGLSSADYGTLTLQSQVVGSASLGSHANYSYVARRWSDLAIAGKYVVGAGSTRRIIDQGGSGLTYSGISAWISEVDREVREQAVRRMDAHVGAFAYRVLFQARTSVTLPPAVRRRVRKNGTVRLTQIPARVKNYIGWPKASGYSAGHLDLVWDIFDGDLRASLISRAPYTLVAPATRGAWAHAKRAGSAAARAFIADVQRGLLP